MGTVAFILGLVFCVGCCFSVVAGLVILAMLIYEITKWKL